MGIVAPRNQRLRRSDMPKWGKVVRDTGATVNWKAASLLARSVANPLRDRRVGLPTG
jgi:hypothetical protein